MPIKQAIAAMGALGCVVLGASARAPEPRRLSGHYVVQWEEQSFQPCGSDEKWWVADPGPLMARYREVIRDHNYGTVYVTVRAEVSDRGNWGHLGMYPRMVAVREVLAARAAQSDDCREHDVEVE